MIFLGPAGNIEGDTLASLQKLHTLKLGAMEVEFVRQVWMKEAMAKEVGKKAKELGIRLSCHASYFINLSSEDQKKIEDSKKRILAACEQVNNFGGDYVVFHAGYYGERTPEETYALIKIQMADLQMTVKKNKWNVILAPETTGRKSQFGTLAELLQLRKEVGCELCVDFAHLYARNNGVIDYPTVFDQLKEVKHIHAHFSGIAYGDKGEKKHLIMEKSFFLPLAKEIIKHKKEITIICESPITYEDSLKMSEVFEGIKRKDD
ncbi:TIM barrel protein [Candidatus Woesearchaeota archaeon]|nr:TIM barrel protein [Candidatus Woesearchaeota archaeon]